MHTSSEDMTNLSDYSYWSDHEIINIQSSEGESDDNMSPLVNVPLVNCPNECCNQGAAKLKTNSGKQICNAVKQGIDYQELARDQEADIEVQAYRTATTGLKVEDVPYSKGQFTFRHLQTQIIDSYL